AHFFLSTVTAALEIDALSLHDALPILEPSRQRLLLDAGSAHGVRMGQSVIDAGGLLGQVIAVTPATSTVLLLTDLDHAVPVLVPRTGLRLVAYGIGRSDRIELRNIPVSADLREGDVVVTSGLGGRFPPGFPVGTVAALRPDDSHAFIVGELLPSAQLDRGRDVLLLQESRDPDAITGTAPVAGTEDAGAAATESASPDVTPPEDTTGDTTGNTATE